MKKSDDCLVAVLPTQDTPSRRKSKRRSVGEKLRRMWRSDLKHTTTQVQGPEVCSRDTRNESLPRVASASLLSDKGYKLSKEDERFIEALKSSFDTVFNMNFYVYVF